MSHYKPYPAYKDSGVEWVGPIPSSWSVMPLFSVAEERTQSNKGMLEDNLLSLSYGNIIRKDITSFEGLVPESYETYQIVEAGDIVFRLTDLQNDKRSLRSAKCSERGIITSAYVAVAPKQVQSSYFSYLMRSYDQVKVFYSMGGGMRQSMKYEDLRRMMVLLPSDVEQQRITAYLDRETTRIDALVEKKARFIELLREKRQALITHAVTKGLDPNVKMKDSGVEWLGEVPEHWEVLGFQRCVHIAQGQVNPEESPYSDMMLIAPNHVESGTGRLLYTETAAEQMAESGKYLCGEGDVIYSKIRPALRKACIAPTECLCSADMYPLRGDTSLLNQYLLWFLLSEPFSAFAVLEADRVAMPKINRESLNALKLALPPISEQNSISNMLTKATTRIDAVVEKTERSIELLKERRSALITAAVTGQIDLREGA